MSRPTTHTLCEQLGRFWAQRTTTGLTFAEASSTTAAHIHAAPLPPLGQRPSTGGGASVTPAPAGGPAPEGLDVTTTRLITIEAHASDSRAAIAMLEDLRSLLRAGERPFADPRTRGLIGMPTLGPAESAQVWRVIGIEFVNEPQPLVTGTGPDASPDGEAVASWTIAVRAVPALVAYAFGLWQATVAPTVTAATAEIDVVAAGARLVLDATPDDQGGGDQAISLGPTSIGALAATIDALGGASGGWETDNLYGAASGLPASALIGFPSRSVLGADNKTHVLAHVS